MSDVKYYTKYLKYKNKYTQLKTQMGGCDVCHNAECDHGELCGAFQITVTNLAGTELCVINVLPTDNTNKLFEALQETQPEVIDNQRLLLGGTFIEQDRTFESYGIIDNSRILLVIGEDTSTNFYFTDAPETAVRGELSDLETKFAHRKAELRKVIIRDNITMIGDSKFEGCTALVHAEFPSTITSMGSRTFHRCTSLEEVRLSENLTTLGSNTFSECAVLGRVVIPSTVTSMGNNTFYRCIALTHVVLSENLTSLGHSTFQFCRNLERVDIPASVTSIGRNIFNYCDRLTVVVIHNDENITFNRDQGFPPNVNFYTNNPNVTAYLKDAIGRGRVFPKASADEGDY